MKFTKVLNELIQESGVTIGEVARSTGMAKSTLHNLMNGTEPSLTKVQSLAEFFGVTIDYLTTGRESTGDPFENVIKASVHKGVYEVTIKKIVKSDE